MCRIGRLHSFGCALGAFVVAVIGGSLAVAQDEKSPPMDAPPPAHAPAVGPDDAAGAMRRVIGGGGPDLQRLWAEIGRGSPDLQRLWAEQRQRYRALMISELDFCRAACDLTKEQSARVAKEASVMIEEAAAKGARLELAPSRRGGIRLSTDPVPPNAVKVVREGLLKLVKENTTAEQQVRYQAEIAKRAADWRRTAILVLVARLDRTLCFSTAQRELILKIIESNWDDEWGASTLGNLGDEGFPFPAIPSRLIVPHLTVTQRRLWNRLDVIAVVATDVYISYVIEFTDGSPSEFAAALEAAAREHDNAPAAELKKE